MDASSPSSSAGGPGLADSTGPRRNSRRPKYSRFTQQELPACKPILTPKWVILTLLLVSAIFVPIRVVSLLAFQEVVEIIDRYETVCVPENAQRDKIAFIQSPQDKTCSRTLKVQKKMEPPIYVYYQLDNFYQNHRRYVKSRSDQQLRNPGSANDTDTCKPEGMANTSEHKQEGHLVEERQGSQIWKKYVFSGDIINATIQNNYNTYSFNGKKKLVPSTTTWLGRKNDFIGIAYLTVGGFCFVLAMVFTLIYLIKPRQLGDPSYLSWNRNPGCH